MIDLHSFHDSAVRAKPKNQTEKPSTFWVAILKTNQNPAKEHAEEDFLWIKCHGKVTAQTLRTQYEKNCVPDEPWVLKHESKVVSLQATIADLNTYRDQVIVFEAVKASDDSGLNNRQPLQPTNNQVLSPSQKKQESSQAMENVKPSLLGLYTQASNSRDENHRFQQGFHPQQAYAAGAQHIPANNISPYASPYTHTLSPTALHRSIPASHMAMQPPSQAYRVTSPAMQRHCPTTSAPLPHQSRSTSNHSSHRNSKMSPSSMSPSDTESTQNGFNLFCQHNREKFRICYPDHTEGQLHDSLVGSWRGITSSERHSWVTQAKASQAKHEVKAEPKLDTNIRESPVVDEPPITAAELEEQKQQTFQLQTLFKDASPQMLESSVEQGVKLLERLRAPLIEKLQNSPDAEQWIQQIDKLRKQAVKTKTIIGVVGNTGAGKSSVINAMLEEERLVPTNCMRACTAVVTEISYNYEEEPYRAQIEFVSLADWEKELKVLFQDLFDGNGQVSRECANEETDAGIAYAKIKAVYPQKTKEDIANSSINTMLREVSHVLGTSRDIKETESLQFYKKLQHFVDSKEKSTGLKDKDKKKERKELEFWPLIRVVRIHVKSPALATGAVIVDLPGVHDANAARAAVAEGYMKQCTGLWIVAPINRAVDDKAAKSLLGESFKRQLKMDGGFNSVTFICSKTDDISLGEAQDSLGLDDEMAPSWAEIDELSKKQKSMKKQLEEIKDSKAVYGEVMNDVDEQIEVWDALKEKLDEGEQVFAPKPKGAQKRKTGSKEKPRKKQRRTITSDDEEDVENSDFEDKDSDEDEDEQDGASSQDESQGQELLTEEHITTKLQELRTTKKEARSQKMEITEQITKMRKEIDEADKAEQKITSKMSALCISGRNQYSKGAIQQDFAAGIRELDQELAAEEDEESFNPDIEIRDYDEVARGLPVFCVSSRGYQKLKGRLRKDPHVSGFMTVEETGIPQLQAHCEKLTETGRSANCRAFNNKLSQLLNSLTLWAAGDGTGANMTAEQKAREARYLQKGLATLESGLENAVKTACKELSDELTDNIFDKYETAIASATEGAIATAFQWGAPVNRENRAAGGLHWATYKAICRRNGIYTNSQGPHEWNIALAEPMIKVIASGWEKVFTRRSPMVMVTFGRHAASALKKFHRDIEARARKIGAGIASLSMLQQQVSVYETILKDLSTTAKDTINTHQKETNREFTPVIERAMQTAYQQCVDERGTGSYARMKVAMNSHVAQERHKMFQESADNVRKMLVSMIKEVGTMMDDKADEVFVHMKRDYRAVLGGGDVQQDGEILPKTQRLVRKEIMRIIDGVEKVFMRVAGLEVEEDDEDQDGEGEERESQEADGDSDGGDGKEEEEAAGKIKYAAVKREATPSGQLADEEDVQREPAASADEESMADVPSDNASETILQSTEAQQVLEGAVRAKARDDDDSSSSFQASDSE